MKKATSIEEQIALYRNRNMIVEDEAKAKEILMDIGYYRLGFYCSAFEVDYPQIDIEHRTHQYQDGTTLRSAIDLYYFDCDLRDLLSTALHRVEVNFRTKVCYFGSNAHKDCPTWFADNKFVERPYAHTFAQEVYASNNIAKSKSIRKHHKTYPNDRFAPAWKTIEFMTFGQVLTLYRNIQDQSIKKQIAQSYGINKPDILEKYIRTLKDLRNMCAHNTALFDATLPQAISRGPARGIQEQEKRNVIGAIRVLLYLLNCISHNRACNLRDNLNDHIRKHRALCPHLQILSENLSF